MFMVVTVVVTVMRVSMTVFVVMCRMVFASAFFTHWSGLSIVNRLLARLISRKNRETVRHADLLVNSVALDEPGLQRIQCLCDGRGYRLSETH